MMLRKRRDKVVSVHGPENKYTLLMDGHIADRFGSRLIGLIGTRSLGTGKGLLIYPCGSVHTWFMSMPIDVVYVSSANRVVGVDRNLRPWHIGTLRRGVRYVIEVAANGASQVEPGDRLTLVGWVPPRKPRTCIGDRARAKGSGSCSQCG